ncbi:MAG: glycerate kinase [Ignavibacteria bacterium]|nr:glycerate kinase [Ignavibacteria bacterium]
MSINILISPNSFKECIGSVKLSSLIAEEFDDLQSVNSIMKPISDGGDGFLEVCRFHFGGEILNYKISTPYENSEMVCPVLYNNDFKTIYIESANVLGLKIVSVQLRNPLNLSSKGLGELLFKIENDVASGKINADKIVVGIGGTATIDMGIGACSALGMQLFDEGSKEILSIPKNFSKVKSIEWKAKKFPFQIELIIDVENPLLGESGAVKVFSYQKGASEGDVDILENGFINIVNLLQNNKIIGSSNPLFGAGGGIPSLLHLLLSAKIRLAKDFILNDLNIRELKEKVDFVITGEGAFDSQ